MSKFLVSDYFPNDCLKQNGYFSQLDEADATLQNSLVYCQNFSFLDLANKNANVSAIITTRSLAAEPIPKSKAVVIADDPRFVFFNFYVEFYSNGNNTQQLQFGLGQNCIIHPSAVVSAKSCIGNRVEIGPGVVIADFVEVKDDVVIGANAVLGAEGLLTVRRADGTLLVVKHAGGVSVGNGTVILAGAIVAKSLFNCPTTIGAHCQIGIMANIGHGVTIGEQSVISGNTVIAGRTKVGRRVWIGASVSVAQGLVVGDEAQIKMGSVVVENVAPGAIVSGNFAVAHKAHLRRFLSLKQS